MTTSSSGSTPSDTPSTKTLTTRTSDSTVTDSTTTDSTTTDSTTEQNPSAQPSAAPSQPGGSAELAALGNVYTGELAAIYGIQTAGGRTTDATTRTKLAAELEVHRDRRDRLADRIVALGGVPPAVAAFAVPPLTDNHSIWTLLGGIDTRLAAVYGQLLTAGQTSSRSAVLTTITDYRSRARSWNRMAGADTTCPFPAGR